MGAFQVPFRTTEITALATGCWDPRVQITDTPKISMVAVPDLAYTDACVTSPSRGGQHSC